MLKALLEALPRPARKMIRDSVVRAGTIARLVPHGSQVFHDIRRVLPKEQVHTVFDIGANVGQSLDRFRTEWPAARIRSFEPDPDTFAKLKASASSGADLYNIGFGREAATVRWNNSNPLSVVHRIAADQSNTAFPTVQFNTLDLFCKGEGVERIDFLKIDTEGHDLAVLEGGSQMLSANHIGIVMTEVSMNSSNRYHVPFVDMHRFMDANGFHLFGIYEQQPDLDCDGNPYLHRSDVLYISPKVNKRNKIR